MNFYADGEHYDLARTDALIGDPMSPDWPETPLRRNTFRALTAPAPGNTPRPLPSAEWPARKDGNAPALTQPTDPHPPLRVSSGPAVTAGSASCATGAACSPSPPRTSSARRSPGAA